MSNNNAEFSQFDKEIMNRCFLLAIKGSGFTAPNPMVGAIIIKDGQIIGEGYHEYFGGSHAEINAIANATQSVKGASIYVNLEPCSHYGKTPPCSLALISNGFSKVFIANLDPNPLVAGKGVKALEKAGIEVKTGLLEKEGLKLNEKFFHFITTKTPFVALKTATSLDGKIATSMGESQWITGEKSRNEVHLLRQDYSAILVGINTVLKDNPSLNVRLKGAIKNPIRIILDSQLQTPEDSNILKSTAQVIIAHTQKTKSFQKDKFHDKKHIALLQCPKKENYIDLEYLFKELTHRNIDSILIEGGAEVNFNILKNNLAQKIYAFIAPIIIGGQNSKAAFGGLGFEFLQDAKTLKELTYKKMDMDILIEGYF